MTNEVRKNIRQKEKDSSKKIMPVTTVPNAPMPVHIAYAVPRGIVVKLMDSDEKLNNARTMKPIEGHRRLKLADSFKNVVKPTSKIPAAIRYIQAILLITILTKIRIRFFSY